MRLSMTHAHSNYYFETICQLAETKDEQALKNIIDVHACVDVARGQYSCVMWLAKMGKQEAVSFLLERFKANVNDAAQGYAYG